MALPLNKQVLLERIFSLLREGESPEALILELLVDLTPGDVSWIMKYVEKLHSPSDYMDDLDEYDPIDNAKAELIVLGFFKFVDLISALIMRIGNEAIVELKKFETSDSEYAIWIVNYCTDQRFRKEISESFPFLEL